MVRNLFTTNFRNFVRNKFYTSLNIIGLSVGLVCTILIVLYIQDELSYDKYNTNYKRIVRLGSDFTLNGKRDRVATSAMPFGATFKNDFPEVEDFVRFIDSGRQQLKYEDKDFYEERMAFADSSVFKIFSFKLKKGDPHKALTQPNSIVLNESLAKKYFGNANPVGKILLVGENEPYTVTGVMKDIPSNSHFHFDGFYSMKTLEKMKGADKFNSIEPISFWNFSNYTFLLLKENTNASTIIQKFPGYYEKYMKSFADKLGVSYQLIVQNLADIHLKSDLKGDSSTIKLKHIYILSAVAVFILLIASINYMNMATARSAKRAKEVGIRKVLGAARESIVGQFLMESIFLTILALAVAFIIVELVLPVFNHLVHKEMSLSVSETPHIIAMSIGIAIALGIISGSYPAFYLSSFRPVVILKSTWGLRNNNGFLRKILVVSQFTVASVMISGTLIVASQLAYMNEKDVGFNKENILIAVVRDSVLQTKIEPLKQELKKNRNVKAVATSSYLIGFANSKTVHLFEGSDGMEEYVLDFNFVDFDYIDLMEMKILQGRKFDRKFSTDTSSAFIINKTTAEKFNWGESAIGKKLQFGIKVGENDDDVRFGEVIGVVNDFHYQSLQNKIEPINFVVSENPAHRNILHVRISSEDQEATLSYIEEVWNEFSPNMSFGYFFLDDRMKENYESEERITWIFSIFSLISILIASMGLFGLSSFMAEQRTKELGIRKVLGASVQNLIHLLTLEFIQLILMANVFAIPIAYWALTQWLNDFSYRVSIDFWIFVVTLVISLTIGLFTVSWQSYRAAISDPIKAIKYE